MKSFAPLEIQCELFVAHVPVESLIDYVTECQFSQCSRYSVFVMCFQMFYYVKAQSASSNAVMPGLSYLQRLEAMHSAKVQRLVELVRRNQKYTRVVPALLRTWPETWDRAKVCLWAYPLLCNSCDTRLRRL